MTLTFDPSTDFEDVCDGLAAVSLNHRQGESESITAALRREVTTREAIASNGKYTTADTRFHFPISSVDASPKLGDTIEDADDEYYTILEVQRATISRRFKCVCRNLAVVNGLDSIVTIEKVTYSKGTQGARERAWATWRKVKARIQPIAAATEKAAGMQRTMERYAIVCAVDAAIDNSYRFKGPDGTLYQFESFTGSEELGGLQTVEVTKWQS